MGLYALAWVFFMLKEWIKENLTEIEIWMFIVMWIFGMISAVIDTIWAIKTGSKTDEG